MVQIYRLQWKKKIIEELERNLASPPMEVPENLLYEEQILLNYHPMYATGEYEHEKEIHLGPRYCDGTIGYKIITPLRRASGSSILINRGWVPKDKKDPSTRPETLIKGPVTVHGLLRLREHPGPFNPPNDAAHNQWIWLDTHFMAESCGGQTRPIILDAIESGPNSLPLGGKTNVEVFNRHLEYAVTWGTLGTILLGMAIRNIRR